MIKCTSRTDCLKIAEEINKNKNGIKAKIPAKKNPRLLILGIENDIDDNDIVGIIASQNDNVKHILNQENNFMKMISSRKDRLGSKFVILETSPQVWQTCTKLGQLFIGYKCCPVKQSVFVPQCYNCLSFGHISKFCTNKPVCSKCGNEHSSSTCQANSMAQCFNCLRWKSSRNYGLANNIDINHSVFSKECPYHKKASERAKNRIDYGY